MTTVPLWEHVTVVLALLVSNAFLFFVTKRRIETLQMALVAKRALLPDDTAPIALSFTVPPQRQHMVGEDTWRIQDQHGNRILDIKSSHPTTLEIS